MLFSTFIAACGGTTPPSTSPAPHESSAATTSGDIKAPGEAKPGDRTTCPVSNETFTVADSSPSVEHEGKTYYFCCGGCVSKFKADPAKYLSKPNG